MKVELAFRPDDPDDDKLIATVEFEDDEPTVELELKMVDGELTCTALTVRKTAGITSRDSRVPLVELLGIVARHPVLRDRGSMRPKGQRQRQRRELTDDFLRDVLETYTAAEEGKRVATVREKHFASESQVYRWLKAARERGLVAEGGDDGER